VWLRPAAALLAARNSKMTTAGGNKSYIFWIYFSVSVSGHCWAQRREGISTDQPGKTGAKKLKTNKKQNTLKDCRTRPFFIFSMSTDSSEQFLASFSTYMKKSTTFSYKYFVNKSIFYVFPKNYKNFMSQ
jgi:hypothetical protein